MKRLLPILFAAMPFVVAAKTYRVLFIGNSYTTVNNLPQLVQQVAAAAGDTLITDSNAPGGFTFQGHCTDVTTLGKIAQGTWDFVVLQEQSQRPAFPDAQVAVEVFPFARKLDSMIKAQNACAQTLFYMTWGRKNGDAANCTNFPPLCTYAGMDSLLRLRYRQMADSNNALLSPVGAVWRYIRANYPLLELYQADESHPSAAGSYAAALCFYTVITRKNPLALTFSSTVAPADAANIRTAVKAVVFDSLSYWHVGEYDPQASFSTSISGNVVTFQNNSMNALNYSWHFGDNTTDTAVQPTHQYAQPGVYTIQLIASNCGYQDTVTQTVTISATGLSETEHSNTVLVFPNPAGGIVNIRSVASPRQSAVVSVADMTGRNILKVDWNEGADLQLDTRVLPAGQYILQIVSGQKVSQSRLLLKHE